jgi:hypothetical protein
MAFFGSHDPALQLSILQRALLIAQDEVKFVQDRGC